jgi:pilus assembly protein CpaC
MVIVTPQIVRPIPAGHPLPELHYPVPFLQPNTGKDMTTPGQSVTGAVPVTPHAPAIPFETLMKSLEPEKPLSVNSTTSTYGSSGSGQSSGIQSSAPAPH